MIAHACTIAYIWMPAVLAWTFFVAWTFRSAGRNEALEDPGTVALSEQAKADRAERMWLSFTEKAVEGRRPNSPMTFPEEPTFGGYPSSSKPATQLRPPPAWAGTRGHTERHRPGPAVTLYIIAIGLAWIGTVALVLTFFKGANDR